MHQSLMLKEKHDRIMLLISNIQRNYLWHLTSPKHSSCIAIHRKDVIGFYSIPKLVYEFS